MLADVQQATVKPIVAAGVAQINDLN